MDQPRCLRHARYLLASCGTCRAELAARCDDADPAPAPPRIPRPRDFLEAELLRYQDLRGTRRYADPAIDRAVRVAIDRRIDMLLDELGTA